jgi:heptosyltransferase-1
MSLEQVAQVLAGARGVVSIRAEPSTAALDKPNFTLYGPTDPGLIGGYGKNQHVVRRKAAQHGRYSRVPGSATVEISGTG